MRELSFADVRTLLERIPKHSDIVLVGGQALNYWAEALDIASTTSKGSFGPALSADIDFLGSAADARSFGQATSGKVRIAGLADPHTPNTALVDVEIKGDRHLIDFLGSLRGFSARELEQVRKWAVPVGIAESGRPPLYVMHPLHCLQSQLANVYGSVLDRRSEPGGKRYAGRIRLGVEACRRVVLQHVERGDVKSALVIAEKLYALSLLPAAMRARLIDRIRIDTAIPESTKMPKLFLERRLPGMRRTLERKFKGYRNRHW